MTAMTSTKSMGHIDMSKMTVGGPPYFSSDKSACYYVQFCQIRMDMLKSIGEGETHIHYKLAAKASLLRMIKAEREVYNV